MSTSREFEFGSAINIVKTISAVAWVSGHGSPLLGAAQLTSLHFLRSIVPHFLLPFLIAT
jgi:hypothetical protein